MEKMSKSQKRKVLIVRIVCFALAALMVLGSAYLALSFLFV